MNFGQKQFEIVDKSAKLIYRDLIKMIKKTRPSYQHKAVLAMLRNEFEKNRNLVNPKDIDILKRNAGKAIADSYVYHIKQEYLNSNTKDNNTHNKI